MATTAAAAVPYTLVILTTLVISLSAPLLSASSSQCLLSTRWQSLFSSHSPMISQIQDRYDCCGFNSLKDRPWPLPGGKDRDFLQCAKQFKRTISCVAPWAAEMRRVGGLALGLGILVGFLQIGHLIYNSSNDPWPANPFAWMREEQQPGRIQGIANRRLLTDGDDEETRVEPYCDDEEAAAPALQEPNVAADRDASDRRAAAASAVNENTPRVEPTNLGEQESNQWRS